MKKLFLIISCIIWFTSVHSQGDGASFKISGATFTPDDIAAYGKNIQKSICLRVYLSVYNGHLKVYRDAAFKEQIDFVEFYEIGASRETMTIANPDNPDDIYDLIDTVVITPVSPDNFEGFELLPGNNTIRIISRENKGSYFKMNEVLARLSPEQKAFINYSLGYQLKLINEAELKKIAEKQFFELGKQLYQWATVAKIAAYRKVSLTQKTQLTVEELEDLSAIKENKSIQNPANPQDKYDLIDTVIVLDFKPEWIDQVKVCHAWKTDKNLDTKIEPWAIAPMVTPVVTGIRLPPRPLFFADLKDVEKLFGKDEKEFYNFFFKAVLRNKGAGANYSTEISQDGDYWEE